MTGPLLSAAMIVRDEAHHLPDCLRSIRDLVDEIVIVDTGSTDDTVAIARSFGARVEVHPWQQDFATPRNRGLDLARGRWILYIDADERVAPLDVPAFRAQLACAQELCWRVRLRPFSGATPYWEYRLWRSDPRIRFANAMHEKVTPAISAVLATDGLRVHECELLLEHVGYDGDQSHKHQRNRPLLEAQLARDADDPYSWRHLSAVLGALGEHDQAEAALLESARRGRDRLPEIGALAVAELSGRRRDRGEDVDELLEDAVRRFPNSFAVLWVKVVAEIAARRHEVALRWLERFDVDPDMPAEDIVAYSGDLFGARAAEARALCLFRLGHFDAAAQAYRRAEELEPEQPSHRVKRQLCEARVRANGARAARQPHRSRSPGRLWSPRELLSGLAVDIAGMSVELSATDAMRAQAVHVLLGQLPRARRAGGAALRFTRHRLDLPEREADECWGAMRFWHEAPVSVTYGDQMSARVDGARAEIGGDSDDLGRSFHCVGPFLLAALLADRGRFVLHAAAVQRDQETLLVLGGSGAGKSTIAAGALAAGWRVLSDDLVAVMATRRGPCVRGLPRRMTVPGEAVPAGSEAWPLPGDPRERFVLEHVDWRRGWHPVTAVVLAGHGQAGGAAAEQVDSQELLGALIGATLSRRKASLRRYLPVAVRMCGLPARHLLLSRDANARGVAEWFDAPPRAIWGGRSGWLSWQQPRRPTS